MTNKLDTGGPSSHWDRDYLVCPYCNYIFQDVIDHLKYNCGQTTCERCSKVFYFSQNIEITWDSKPLDCANGLSAHQWKDKKTYRYCVACEAIEYVEEGGE